MRVGLLASIGKEQHVAPPDQRLGALRVDDRSGINMGGDRKRDAGRDVRLDRAGDDIYTRPLSRNHEMDSGRARELGKPADGGLHLGGSLDHQVGEFVDDHDDVGHALLKSRLGVVTVDVADPGLVENVVAAVHLPPHRAQNARRLLYVGDDRAHEVRNAVEQRELDSFRVDHYETQVLRRVAHQQARDNRAQADRLAGVGGAADQQVRHLGQVGVLADPADVLAERDHEPRRIVAELLGLANSRKNTGVGELFGTSTPIAALPGIGASTRTWLAARSIAMLSASAVIRATRTPGPS